MTTRKEHICYVPQGRHALDSGARIAGQIHAVLRQRIVGLQIPPGASLSRTVLCRHFGVSLTPVRDALLRLQDEGLVETQPQHLTRVTPIDLAAVRAVHFMQMALELEHARMQALHAIAAPGASGAAIPRFARAGSGELERFRCLPDVAAHDARAFADEAPVLRAAIRRGDVVAAQDSVRRRHAPLLHRLALFRQRYPEGILPGAAMLHGADGNMFPVRH